MIFLLDPDDDKIIEANGIACKMRGYSHAELLSTSMSAVHTDEMPPLIKFTQSVLHEGSGWTDQLTCLTKSGKRLPADISASVLELNGRPCVIAVMRNIAASRRAEKALREHEERTQQEMPRQWELAAKVHRSLLPKPIRHGLIHVDVR